MVSELAAVKYLNRLGRGKIDLLTSFVSSISFLVVFWSAIVMLAFLSFPAIREELVARVFVVTVLHFGITEGIFKYLAVRYMPMRKRPYLEYPDEVVPVGHQFSDASFPSSHMASTAAMMVVLVSFFPTWWVAAVVFTLFMSFARVHNGMHYPSDVIFGLLVGAVYGLIALAAV